MPAPDVESAAFRRTPSEKEVTMEKLWEISAQKYLNNVFYRREIDAEAKAGDKYAASVIATAAAISK
jgi:hypothetical protein